jgi:hypothetical protein
MQYAWMNEMNLHVLLLLDVPETRAYTSVLGTRWRWMVSFTPPAALPPEKEPLVDIE